jgi:hypothetical protein
LEKLVTPLMGCLQAAATAAAAAADQTTAAAFEPAHRAGFLLHVLCGVRGYKSVVRFFPHEAADLERTLALLREVECAGARPAAECGAVEWMSPEGWELQRVLLVWLSMLALVPFDLFTIDTTADTEAERQRLEVRLVAVCTHYLCAPGAVRDAAAVVLGRLLTRPDLQSNLQVHRPSPRMNAALYDERFR